MATNTNVNVTYQAYDKTKTATARVIRGLTSVSRAVFSLKGTLFAAAGVGGLGYMIKKQMDAIDATAKLSDRLGVTTEALVSLQHAAQIGGVEQATLNKGLEIFSRRLGEVGMGTGEAERALDALNLSAEELAGLTTEQAIYNIADAINGLSTQSEKAAAANYLFGRSGQQLLNMFSEGSRGLKAYQEEVDRLGISFSRIDAARVEAANDALTRTRAVFTGLFRTTTIELAPYLSAAATAFTDWALAGEGVGSRVTDAFASISKGAIYFSNILNDIHADMLDLRADAAEFLHIYQFFSPLKGGPSMPYISKDVVEGLRQQAEAMRQAGEDNINAVEQFFENLRTAKVTVRIEPSAIDKALADFDKALDAYEQQYGEKNAWFGLAEQIGTAFDAAGTHARRFFYEVKSSGLDALDATVQAAEQWRRSLDEAEQTAETIRDRTYALARMYDAMGIYDDQAYQVRMSLLKQEVEEFRKLKISETDIARYELERQREAIKEYARQSNDILAGMRAGYEQLERDRMTLGEAGYRMWHDEMPRAMTDAFYNMTVEGAAWRDAMKGFFSDIHRAFSRLMAQMAAEAVMQDVMMPAFDWLGAGIGALFSAGIGHRGGIAGVTNFPTRMVSPAVFAHAERRHGGLRSNEIPAILERDEHVLTPPQMNVLVGAAAAAPSAAEAIIQDTLWPAFNWLRAGIGALFSAGAGAGFTQGSPGAQASYAQASYPVHHRGGIAGEGASAMQWLSPSVFAHAERRHGGLRSNEIPAILERDEHVLTPPQMNALVGAAAAPSAAEAIIQDTLRPAFNWLRAGIGALFSAGAGAGFTQGSPGAQASYAQASYPVHHRGGIAGEGASAMRWLSPSVFAHAERRHSGLRSNEIPAILEQGEHVLTPPQMNTLVTAAAAPSAGGGVQINVTNKGPAIEAEQANSYWDGDKLVVDVITKALETNAPLRRGVQQAVGR